jgi:hypothetical protein
VGNIKVLISDLRDKVFNKGETISVSALVTASNLLPSKGEVNVIFDDNVKLVLETIYWVKNSKELKKTEFIDIPENMFTDKGLYLGDVPVKNDSDFYGNVLISYNVVKAD